MSVLTVCIAGLPTTLYEKSGGDSKEVATAIKAIAITKEVEPDFNKTGPSYWSSTDLPPSSGARDKSHGKKGGKTQSVNYRGISLVSHAGKIFLKVVVVRRKTVIGAAVVRVLTGWLDQEHGGCGAPAVAGYWEERQECNSSCASWISRMITVPWTAPFCGRYFLASEYDRR